MPETPSAALSALKTPAAALKGLAVWLCSGKLPGDCSRPAGELLHAGVAPISCGAACLLIWLSEAAVLRRVFWPAGVAGSCPGFGAERANRSVL